MLQISGGIGSWAAGRRWRDEHPHDALTALFCDVADGNPLNGEDPDVYDFVRAGAADLGADLVWLNDGRSVWDVFRENRWLGNSRTAHCSWELKTKPAHQWIEANCDPASTTIFVGIDWSEAHRLDKIRAGWAPWRVEAPLMHKPYIDKVQAIALAAARGLPLPSAYAKGYPHANCGGTCVKSGVATWRRTLLTNPERYAHAEAMEGQLREELGDVSMLTDRSDGQRRPLTLAVLRQRVTEGDQLDMFDEGGCGCFSEASA